MKKSNKSKGFTLIELLVVISIISLLSSIVLASIKTAREKAVITKTVAEMKSLQTAIELYRNQFGVYPSAKNANDSGGFEFAFWCGGCGQLSDLGVFVTENLINNKFISSVPHSPNYPNNCTDVIDNNCDYILGYSPIVNMLQLGSSYDADMICGDKKVDNYYIYIFTNDKKMNLPILKIRDNNTNEENNYFLTLGDPNQPPYTYCLSM